MSLNEIFETLIRRVVREEINRAQMKQPPVDETERYFSVKEASEYLGVSDKTIRLWLKNEKIIGKKIGSRTWRIKRSDLDKAGQTQEAVQPDAIADEIIHSALKKVA